MQGLKPLDSFFHITLDVGQPLIWETGDGDLYICAEVVALKLHHPFLNYYKVSISNVIKKGAKRPQFVGDHVTAESWELNVPLVKSLVVKAYKSKKDKTHSAVISAANSHRLREVISRYSGYHLRFFTQAGIELSLDASRYYLK